MSIARFSVKNSLLVNLISLFILIAGFYTLFVYKIRKEAFPEVSYDVVLVDTFYPGAPPEEIERLVTVPLEREVKGVDGIEEMTSTSLENRSNITIKISQDIKDKAKVVNDIQKAVDRVRDLPAGVEDDPLVTEITSGEIPVIQIALSGQLQEALLQEHVENLEDILQEVPGVSSVKRRGWRNREVWVEVDPDKIIDLHVSVEEIMESLRRRNRSIPGGKLRGETEFSIRTTGEFFTLEEIEEVVIRANESGNWLKVGDVAQVRFAFEDEDTINKSFGTRSINLVVIKRASGDAVKIVDEVKRKTAQYLEEVEAPIKVSYINDISYYIKRRLGVLKNNGIVGLFLVCGVLMLFLNKRIAILTALGLPIAFSATLAVMGVIDLSINLVSMFGLIIVLGMLVDDGIIVAENAARYLEEGLSPKEAAIKGTEEVVKPVATTVITTIAAFSPLLFMEGMLGKFIWAIPLVVIIALLCSLMEAFVILPSHFADFVSIKNFRSKRELPWFKKILSFYTRLLNAALNRRYLVMAGLLVLLLVSGFMASRMKFVLFGSEEGIEQFYIKAEADAGTNLYTMNGLMADFEDIVSNMPQDQLEAFTTEVGSIGESWFFDPYGKSGSHVGQVTVYLTPYTQRHKTVSEIIEELRPKVMAVEGFQRVYFDKDQGGPPVGKPIAMQIRGENFAVLNEIAQKASSFLSGIKGVSDITSDYEVGRKEIHVLVDTQEAARAYLSVGEIAASIRNAFKGGIATSIKPVKAEEEIDVLVRFPLEQRKVKDSFHKLFVPNRFGNLIPLSKIARLEEKISLARVKHLDGKRVVTVNGEVDKENVTSESVSAMLAEEFKDIPQDYPGYRVSFGGEQEENVKSKRSFVRAFGLAFLLVFFILAANFGSLIQPLMVMSAIPFGLIGVVWAFRFHGYPLSFFMMMGIVGLMGIVVNDSIVLVDFINNLRAKGSRRRDSIVESGRLRLRPVLLTTITTALGLAPTAYGIGGGDPFLRPMALTIVWGVVCATALTLVVLPCIYAVIDDITLKILGHPTVKRLNGNR
jgi:multidrug efflux pump subunit AcrB